MRIDTCGRSTAVVAGLLYAGAVLVGCARTEEYQLGQRIDMGPYSFEVLSAGEGTWASQPTINILFRLERDDAAPFTSDFRRSFAYKMEVVDAAGNAFPVDPAPRSPVYRAGRYRSDRYLAEVRLSAFIAVSFGYLHRIILLDWPDAALDGPGTMLAYFALPRQSW